MRLNAVQRLVAASPCVIDVYSGCVLICNGQLCLCLSFLHDPMHICQSRQLNLFKLEHAYIHDTTNICEFKPKHAYVHGAMNICEYAGWSHASSLPQHDVEAALAQTWSGRMPPKTSQFFQNQINLNLNCNQNFMYAQSVDGLYAKKVTQAAEQSQHHQGRTLSGLSVLPQCFTQLECKRGAKKVKSAGTELTLYMKAAQDGTKDRRSIAIMSKVMTSKTCTYQYLVSCDVADDRLHARSAVK